MDVGLFTAHEEYGPATLLEHAELAEVAGFDEVEIHSASPDQEGFVEVMTEEVLPAL